MSYLAVRLLGRLGGLNQAILQTYKSGPKWDYEKFNLYLEICMTSNRSMSIFQIGHLLPLLIEITSQGTDRQSKVLASEGLHAIVIYMIGLSAVDPNKLTSSKFAACYSIIFPVIISLASSVDVICRDLFSKLLLQTIHWFSGFGQVHKDEVAALLDSLLNGVCDISNAMTRDTSANGLTEFLRWAIKQSSIKDLESSSGTVEIMFTRLLNLCLNPSESKRLGAGLVFGKIYRIIREEFTLLSKHVLHILFVLYQGHRLGGQSQQEFSFAIQQYITIIKKSVQYKDDEAKLLFRVENRAEPRSLVDLVSFLWEHSSHIDMKFRRKSMYGFLTLAPLLFDHKTPDLSSLPMIRNTIKANDVTFAFDNDLVSYLSLPFISSEEKIIEFLERLRATLDCYNWLLLNKIANPTQLISENDKG